MEICNRFSTMLVFAHTISLRSFIPPILVLILIHTFLSRNLWMSVLMKLTLLLIPNSPKTKNQIEQNIPPRKNAVAITQQENRSFTDQSLGTLAVITKIFFRLNLTNAVKMAQFKLLERRFARPNSLR